MRKKRYITIPYKFELSVWDRVDLRSHHLWYKYVVGKLGWCKHKCTIGPIGSKTYYCMDCEQPVYNNEWKEQKEALNKAIRLHEKSLTLSEN